MTLSGLTHQAKRVGGIVAKNIEGVKQSLDHNLGVVIHPPTLSVQIPTMPTVSKNTLVHSSLLDQAYRFGSDLVNDVQYYTHPLVHAVEQPIANVYTEAKTVVNGAWNMSHSLIHLGAYWVAGWLAWEFVGEYFPREKRMLTDTMNRAFKRARYNIDY